MHVLIFEGSHWNSFAPLSLSRPVFSLVTGMSTLLEKQLRALQPTRLTLWVRPGLAEHTRREIVPKLKVPTQVNTPTDDEPVLIMSGRTLHFTRFEPPTEPSVVVDEGNIVRSAYTKSPGLTPADVFNRTPKWMELLDLPQTMPQSRMVHHVWDLISWNEESLVQDFISMKDRPGAPDGAYYLIDGDDVSISPDAKIGPGVVFDASRGPIYVAQGATIGANAVLLGPCYVGPYSIVTALAHIRSGTTIGPICKVGGEVSNSIIQGYTNKPHEGFLGDSYLGEWVNFGAGSNTSNLKNTYGEIDVRIGDRTMETSRRFLGAMVGDHTKMSVGTRLTTGAYVGYCCMLGGSGLTPKFTPSFTFWTDKGSEKYQLEKAKEVMASVFTRRNRRWSDSDEELLNYVAEVAPSIEA